MFSTRNNQQKNKLQQNQEDKLWGIFTIVIAIMVVAGLFYSIYIWQKSNYYAETSSITENLVTAQNAENNSAQ